MLYSILLSHAVYNSHQPTSSTLNERSLNHGTDEDDEDKEDADINPLDRWDAADHAEAFQMAGYSDN